MNLNSLFLPLGPVQNLHKLTETILSGITMYFLQ